MSYKGGKRELKVETHDGYKGGEKPRKVIFGGREYLVKAILASSRVRRIDGEGDEEHFKVDLDVYGEAEIVYHHSWDGWSLEEKKAPKSFSDLFVESAGRG